MMKKRILAATLALTLVFGTATAQPNLISDLVGGTLSASADNTEYTSGLWRYTLRDDGTVCISAYSGFDTNLTLPSKLDGRKVTAVGKEAFSGNKNIGKIIFPSTITSIGYKAFYNSSITSLQMSSESACTFDTWCSDSYAFANCKSLKTAYINTYGVGNYAFEGCTALTTVRLSSNVWALNISSFSGTSALKTFKGSENLEYIGKKCFENSGISSFKMSSKLTTIGYMAFAGSKLTSVTIPASVTELGIWLDEASTFQDCRKLKKAVISCENVPASMFKNCVSLTSVTIGKKTKNLGDSAFYHCQNLKSFKTGGSLDSVYPSCFEGCSSLSSINLGTKLTFIGDSAFKGSGLTSIAIPSSVYIWGSTWYGSRAFANCSKLKNVYIGQSTMGNLDSDMVENIFENSPNVKITCIKGSKAYTYAKNNGISVALKKSIPAKSLSLNKSTYTVKVGDTLTLNPNVSPVNTTDRITWESGNTDVVTVTSDGEVVGKEAGTAAIKGTTTSGKVCTATVNVVESGTTSTDTAKKRSLASGYIGVIGSKAYTGKAVKPDVTVYLNYCTKLIKDVDYTVSYSNNVSIGTATVTVKGKGIYTGTIKKTFKIVPKQVSAKKTYTSATNAVRINWNKVAGAQGYIVERYSTAKKKWVRVKKITSAKTLNYKDTGLKAGTAYKYRVKAYKGSAVGKYSATVTAATKPAQVKVTSVKKAKNAVRLTWKKVSCDGYKIQKYNAAKKKWGDVKKLSSSATTYRLTGLSANTVYKFRIVAYKKGGAKYVYSTPSKTVTVRTLKK